jgi:hypothetical protein
MASVLTDAPFTKFTLTYTAQTVTPGAADAFGNPTFTTTTGTVSAFLAPIVARGGIGGLVRLPGADVNIVPVKGELDSPLTFPAGVGVGSVLTLTYAGKASTLTLTLVAPNDLVGVDFGTFFLGDLRVV